MPAFKPTIGLEIHAELKTKTKMFCDSRNDPFEAETNVNICPVCLAHPGTLPVINREAVKHVLRVGAALQGKLADYTEFDRKNYFYPDLPKGYQISQYEFPLVSGGELDGVQITRVHLEEDTASSLHDDATGVTTIDYNRAGVPLMELVTDPVITSAEQAGAFARELQLLLRYLGASEANMEKGEMRVEANISMGKKGGIGTKVEIKNLNSFNAMERAVRYEIARQTKLLEEGKEILQETRGWDEGKQATFAQRVKEGSADYRYFPDPDLPSLRLTEMADISVDALTAGLPELPSRRRARYLSLGIKEDDARSLTSEPTLGGYFDAVLAQIPRDVTPQLAANYIVNDLVKLLRDTVSRDTEYLTDIPISPRNFSTILSMVASRSITSRVAKDLLQEVLISRTEPEAIAKEMGLLMTTDQNSFAGLVDKILSENSAVAEDYKRGKAAALEYLMGQAMRATRGSADPESIRALMLSKLN
ncbi:Asp-tRNA(Asn)/Glu-tRNA(Gln) amidotransferase subunit GatB [Candidatus Kaiserbacteria bacterium]|nr:Asp-tRNA(Asn)/Glu-tRNA(Gln) amidotransferase subunit GatB [Candidatus Kaiserbacteria bacterium]